MAQVKEEAPVWLDSSFLEVALRNYKKDDTIRVSEFKVNSGFSEHFCSTMFQCEIQFGSTKFPKPSLETLNVVIKAEPKDESIDAKCASGGPLFQTEIRMYREVLPAMHQLFQRSGIKIDLEPE